MTPEDSRKEREARSLALEKAYVHDVYDQISWHFGNQQGRTWPKVTRFLEELEPGSLVADVGCGNGKYLSTNNSVFKLGLDRCTNLAHSASQNYRQLLLADNLTLPVRDCSFDAALSIAVIHHFATTERRVRAIRELARILRIGGRLMISVWAMEQRYRKFESQDVLVPWRRPEHSSSEGKPSSSGLELSDPTSAGAVTTTDEDEPPQSAKPSDYRDLSFRQRTRRSLKRRNKRVAETSAAASGISRPSALCRNCGIIVPLSEPASKTNISRIGTSADAQLSSAADDAKHAGSTISSEVRGTLGGCPSCGCRSKLVPYDIPYPGCGGSEALTSSHSSSDLSSPNESCYSFVRRALQVENHLYSPSDSSSSSSEKQKLTSSKRGSTGSSSSGRSWFLSGGVRSEDWSTGGYETDKKHRSLQENLIDVPIELRHLDPDDPALLDIPPATNTQSISSYASFEMFQKESKSKSLTDLIKAVAPSSSPTRLDLVTSLGNSSDYLTSMDSLTNVIRSKSSSSCLSLSSPASISSVSAASIDSGQMRGSQSSESISGSKDVPNEVPKYVALHSIDSGLEIEASHSGPRKRPLLKKQKTSINESEMEPPIMIEISKPDKSEPVKEASQEVINDKDYLDIPKNLGIIKQSSLNDEFIYPDRFMEKEKIKQSIQKQSSLNEDLIYGNKEQKHESLKDILFKAQVKRFQVIRESFEKLRTASLDRFEKEKPESFRNGIVKLLQTWRSEMLIGRGKASESSQNEQNSNQTKNKTCAHISPKLWRKSSGSTETIDSRRESFEDKSLPVEGGEGKSSKEDGSDSSKENSFQSDNSIDSEDSCVSVIFIPKPGQTVPPGCKERNWSVSSESSEGSEKPLSPKSPRSPKSPNSPSCNAFPSTTKYCSSGRLLGPKMTVRSLSNAETSIPTTVLQTPTSDSPKVTLTGCESSGTKRNCAFLMHSSSLDGGNQTNCSKKSSGSNVETYRELFRQNSLTSQSMIDDALKKASAVTSPPLTSPVVKTFTQASKTLPTTTQSYNNPPKTTNLLNDVNVFQIPLSSNVSVKTDQPKPAEKSDISRAVESHQFTNKVLKTNNAKTVTTTSAVTLSHSSKQTPVLKRDSSYTNQLSSLLLGENVEIIRKPASSGARDVQIVRKTVPRFLTFDVFNPETDDLDSDNSSTSSSSSSPSSHSESSVIERSWPTEKDIEELDKEIKRREEQEKKRSKQQVPIGPFDDPADVNLSSTNEDLPKLSIVDPIHKMDTISEEAVNTDSATILERYLKGRSLNTKCEKNSSSMSPIAGISQNYYDSGSRSLELPFSSSQQSCRRPTQLQSGVGYIKANSLPGFSDNFSKTSNPLLASAAVGNVARNRLKNIHPIAYSTLGSSQIPVGLSMNCKQSSSDSLSELSVSSSPPRRLSPSPTRHYNLARVDARRRRQDSLKSRIDVSLISRESGSLNIQSCTRSPLVMRGRSHFLPPRHHFQYKRYNGRGDPIPISIPDPLMSLEMTTSTENITCVTKKPSVSFDTALISRQQSTRAKNEDVLHYASSTRITRSLDENKLITIQRQKEKVELNQSLVTPNSVRHESVVDESGKVSLEKTKITSRLSKQSSFEMPLILQNLFSTSNTDTSKKDTKTQSQMSKNSTNFSNIVSFWPMKFSQETVDSNGKSNCVTNNQRSISHSLDKFKIYRSESSAPLLSSREASFIINQNTEADDLKSLDSAESNRTECFSNALSQPKKSKEYDENSEKITGSVNQIKKRGCRICAREAMKKQQWEENESVSPLSAGKILAKRRETLRPQGSLDSAKSDRDSSGSLKGFGSSLTRSGSLDLDISWREESSSMSCGASFQRGVYSGYRNGDTSLSTSQDSLQSDTGGAPTLHRYYHVFRANELDQLIEKYVQNLHIISSYYDHANWCIVAEKVQVWTI